MVAVSARVSSGGSNLQVVDHQGRRPATRNVWAVSEPGQRDSGTNAGATACAGSG
jgi:hypothetical protein